MGAGPVAGYLDQLPTNLRAEHVQVKPEAALYAIVTNGLAVMPSFKGELSAEDRLAVVRYIMTWNVAQAGRSSDAEHGPLP